MIEKLKQVSHDKTNLIIISGIPGSGKHKLAEYLSRQLVNEQVNTKPFKMDKLENLTKFNTYKFILNLMHYRVTNKDLSCIVATLPSYNHLKKVIFELKKSQEFSDVFDIKFIITKVHARNFYMNKNRNTF